jgi:biopolymer transport protein ExbD
MAHGRLQRRRPIAEMNLVPLIDVSLILVIIFMVITPKLVQHQLTVRLPASSEGRSAQSEKTVHIQINRRGRVSLDGKPVKFAQLEKQLALILGGAKQKTVLVQADKTVDIQRVVRVLDIANRLKVGKLGIGVAQAN